MGAVNVKSRAVKNGATPDPFLAGEIVSRYGRYDIDAAGATLAIASTIKMVPIPAGAQILDIIVRFGAMGASCTMSFGDSGSATRYKSGLDVSSAGNWRLCQETADHNQLHQYAAADYLLVTVAGAVVPVSQPLEIVVTYRNFSAFSDEADQTTTDSGV